MSAQEEGTEYASPLTRAHVIAQYARGFSTPDREVHAGHHGTNNSAQVMIQSDVRFVDVYLTAGHSDITIVNPDHKTHRYSIMNGLIALQRMLG